MFIVDSDTKKTVMKQQCQFATKILPATLQCISLNIEQVDQISTGCTTVQLQIPIGFSLPLPVESVNWCPENALILLLPNHAWVRMACSPSHSQPGMSQSDTSRSLHTHNPVARHPTHNPHTFVGVCASYEQDICVIQKSHINNYKL